MSKKYTIEGMQKCTKDKGDRCMSKEYVDSASIQKLRPRDY